MADSSLDERLASSAEQRLAKLSGSREDALGDYSEHERVMISALEEIATGRTGEGPHVDLGVARQIANETMQKVGWPTAADIRAAEAKARGMH